MTMDIAVEIEEGGINLPFMEIACTFAIETVTSQTLRPREAR